MDPTTNLISSCSPTTVCFHGAFPHDRTKTYLRDPLSLKTDLAQRMARFAPEIAFSDANDLSYLIRLKKRVDQNFVGFLAKFPIEAAMICDLPLCSRFQLWEHIEQANPTSLEELGLFLSSFWREKVAHCEDLALSSTHLSLLSKRIHYMPPLKKVALYGPHEPLTLALFKSIPRLFLPTPLEDFIFGTEKNSLSVLEESSSLTSLSIEGIHNPKLPETLFPLDQLKELAINNCHLSNLPPCVKTLYALETLDLRHNDFTTIPDEIISFPKTLCVDLRENPIQTPLPSYLYDMVRSGRLLFDGSGHERIKPM